MDKTEFQIVLQGAIAGNHNDFEKLISLANCNSNLQ